MTKTIATLLGFLAILSWGLLAVLSVYSKEIQPFQLLFVCFMIATSLVYIYRLCKRQRLFSKPSMSLAQWLVGIVGLFGFHCLYFIAMRFAPAMEVSLIAYLWPLLLGIYVASRAMLGRALLGGLLGFIGVMVLISQGQGLALNAEHWLGYVLALACAFIWSAYSWFLSRYKSATADIAWVTLVCALLALCVHLMLEQWAWSFSVQQWLAMLLLGLGPVGGAFYLWELGMKHGLQNLLAALSFFTPVISALALAGLGLSVLSGDIILVLGLILAGAAVSNRASKR